MNRRNAIPRTAHQAEARARALATLALMRREKFSLAAAAKLERTSPRTVKRYAGSALRRRGPRGRYVAKPTDRLLRVLVIPTREGLREIAVRSSREASQIAQYENAIQRYLQTGDDLPLRKFRRRHIIDANRKRIPFFTDRKQLDRLGSAGVLSFESLYARVR